MRIGIPNGFGLAAEVGLFAIVSLMMVTFGVTAIASNQIVINITSLTFMLPMGLSIATSIRVAQAKGKGDHIASRYSGYTGIIICVLTTALIGIIFITYGAELVSFYSEDLKVQKLAVELLLMSAIFQLSDGMQVGAIGALRGLSLIHI